VTKCVRYVTIRPVRYGELNPLLQIEVIAVRFLRVAGAVAAVAAGLALLEYWRRSKLADSD